MNISTIKLSDLFRRWRKAEWPRSTGPHDPLRGEVMRAAEHGASSQEWEAEGGAIKPAAAPGPKIPL